MDFRVKNRANDTTQFLVRGDGDIGIGTDLSGASGKFQVFGTNTVLARFGNTISTTYEAISIKNTVAGYPAVCNDSSSDTLDLRSMGSVQVTVDSNNNSTGKYFRVATNGEGDSATELFRVGDDGKVGINTATGGASSNAILSIHSPASSACRFNLTNTGSSSAESTQIWSQNNDLVFNTDGDERLRINSDGRALFDRGAPASAINNC